MCLDFDLITAMPVSPKVAAVLGYFQNCSLFSSPDNICRGTICLLSQVRMPCSRLGSLLVLIASTACWCSAQQTYADRCGPHTTGTLLPASADNLCRAQARHAPATISQLKASPHNVCPAQASLHLICKDGSLVGSQVLLVRHKYVHTASC